MVLLTGGQVSAAISGGIVFVFTLLLFFSGYVLQQQTVRSLQTVLSPRLPQPNPEHHAKVPSSPSPPASHNPLARAARPLGQHLPSPYQYLHHTSLPQPQWSKLAYAQVVKSHVEVCNAVMLFAELAKQKSPARRVLLFPRTWTVDKSEDADPLLHRTRRLMRLAARRWGVGLRPMEALGYGVVGGVAAVGKVDEALPSSYSLASLWELTEFERVLYLKGPGVLVDPAALDALLAFAEVGEPPVAGVMEDMDSDDGSESQSSNANALSTSLLLVKPSIATYHQLKQRRAAHPTGDTTLLRSAFPGPAALLNPATSPYYSPAIISTTPHLRRIPDAPAPDAIDESLQNPDVFNATAFLLSTAWVRLCDRELPGPEYDVPYRRKQDVRPQNGQARIVWERLYDVFRGRRMEVCGLDLEGWQEPSVGVVEGKGEL